MVFDTGQVYELGQRLHPPLPQLQKRRCSSFQREPNFMLFCRLKGPLFLISPVTNERERSGRRTDILVESPRRFYKMAPLSTLPPSVVFHRPCSSSLDGVGQLGYDILGRGRGV